MSIAAEDRELSAQVDRDTFRQTLNDTSEAYANMESYINNLESDLRSIETYERDLATQESMGFDVGSSRATLSFQRSQMTTDLEFFQGMKELYLRRMYSDMYKFAEAIALNAATIEPREAGETAEELAAQKMSLARRFDASSQYTMQDAFSMLGVCENLLLELSSDIAAFTPKIQEAEARAQRGFQVGSLISNMRSQQTRLRTEFVASIEQLKEFLKGNANFAKRCLRRIQMISSEIVTEQEARSADPPAGGGAGGAGGGGTGGGGADPPAGN